MSADRVDVGWGQRRLAWVWLAGSALAFAVMILETMGTRAPLDAQRAWQWFLPLVVPTLSLMLGTLVFQGRAAPPSSTVERSVFLISLALSLFYLLALNVLLVAWPLLRPRPEEVMSLIEKSRWWLPAVQGLAGLALGAFFVGHDKKG